MKCGANFRKAVENISDRAKRYRAHSPGCRPSGPKVCYKCGSRRNVVIDHIDGDESNGRKSNLRWECKRHNTIHGMKMAKAGKGVRTRQYNPGAKTLGAYVDAAVNHTRGSHDAGGKVIHETPKAKRREFAREIAWRKSRNPAELPEGKKKESEADKLFRKFHGRKPDMIYETMRKGIDPYGEHPELTSLGPLVRLVVGQDLEISDEGEIEDSEWDNELVFVPSMAEYYRECAKVDTKDHEDVRDFRRWLKELGVPDVAGVPPNGEQLYFPSGQKQIGDDGLRKMGLNPNQDVIDLGDCWMIEYFAMKRFDRFEATNYFHQFGEKTGIRPRLIYFRVPRLLYLAGGEYVVKSVGIDN